MFFRLPFKGMYRPPRQSQGSEADRRNNALELTHTAAQEMSEDPKVKALWAQGNEKELVALCKAKEWQVGQPSYVSVTMIFSALKGILRAG